MEVLELQELLQKAKYHFLIKGRGVRRLGPKKYDEQSAALEQQGLIVRLQPANALRAEILVLTSVWDEIVKSESAHQKFLKKVREVALNERARKFAGRHSK